MESLPTEILAHIFEQFPKCEICQKNCLRASKWQALQMCSNTCARWNKILEGKTIFQQYGCFSDSQSVIGKCFPEVKDVISVTIDMKNAKSLGLKVLNLPRGQTFGYSHFRKGINIHSIKEDGPVALDGKIKGLKNGIAGDSILQVNEINLASLTFDEAFQILKDVVKNEKLQSVRLIVNQNDFIPSDFLFHYERYQYEL